jgi:hypothetical protein
MNRNAAFHRHVGQIETQRFKMGGGTSSLHNSKWSSVSTI